MRKSNLLIFFILSLALTACSSVNIQTSNVEQFAAGNYTYYKWRTAPVPANTQGSDAAPNVDGVIRTEVDAGLRAKGYQLDPERAQFSVGYLFTLGMLEGVKSDQASNISRTPTATINRQVDQASVDNAIALGGVKETSNILLQFNHVHSKKEVWRVLLSEIVQNANRVDSSHIDNSLRKAVSRALQRLPAARS